MGLLFGKSAYSGSRAAKIETWNSEDRLEDFREDYQEDCSEDRDCIDSREDSAGEKSAGRNVIYPSGYDDNKESSHMEEHYDGQSVAEVFENAERPYQERVSFCETRDFLHQVRDCKRKVELLRERIGYYQAAGLSTTLLETDLEYTMHLMNVKIAEVSEEISKIGNVNEETVLTRRYIDLLPWDDIASKLDMRMRTILKFHGRGLPHLEYILQLDEKIHMNSQDDPKDERVGEEV